MSRNVNAEAPPSGEVNVHPEAKADVASGLTRREALFGAGVMGVATMTLVGSGLPASADQVAAPLLTADGTEIVDSNKTPLGLYVSPLEAFEMWQRDPEGTNIVDVRTFEEYLFVGHMTMARNVPLLFPKYIRPEAAGEPVKAGGIPPGCAGELNPDFVPAMQKYFAPDDTILLYCATGGRAAMAVKALAGAGFVKVYNIVTGLEGSRINDAGSVFNGKHMRNGWKNYGLPWGYSFDPDLIEPS